jgi:hypothetical protein
MTFEIWIAVGMLGFFAAGLALRSRDTTVTPPAPGEIPGYSPPPAFQYAPQPEFPPDLAAKLPAMALDDRDTAFFGRWREGRLRGVRVAFQPWGKGVAILAGDFDPDEEQLSEIYLSQVSDAVPLPEESSVQRLQRALGGGAEEIDLRFFLNATGGEYAELRSQAVCHALLGLSESIEEVMLFESGGVQFLTDATATQETIAADLDRAVEIHETLEQLR